MVDISPLTEAVSHATFIIAWKTPASIKYNANFPLVSQKT